jgi:class 3 adenylate cyclase
VRLRDVEMPDVRYARSGDVAIAYQVIGEGPVDLIFVRGFAGDLLSTWDQPLLLRHVLDLGAFSRVIMLDKRGTGLSDRTTALPTLETRMDDLRAVMDDAGSERAVLWSGHEGSRLAVLFAATYPDRTVGLVLFDPEPRGLRSDDYPWAPSEDEWRDRLREAREGWGTREFLERRARELAPSLADDSEFRDWFVMHMRRSLSPGAAVAFLRMTAEADVSDVLAAVRVPTLILHRPSMVGAAEYVRARIRHAEIVRLDDLEDSYTWASEASHELTIRETERFVSHLVARKEPGRVLATLLFTDLVGSTELASRLGDAAWRDVLTRHHAIVRWQLARHRGQEVDTAGDGFLAYFDGPGRAIGSAVAIREELGALDLVLRAGIHTGECELVDGKPSGIAVVIASRVVGAAGAGEILVTSTVRDLLAGSDIGFEYRGEHELKGVRESWRLYAVGDA